jgi:hypothetical protein
MVGKVVKKWSASRHAPGIYVSTGIRVESSRSGFTYASSLPFRLCRSPASIILLQTEGRPFAPLENSEIYVADRGQINTRNIKIDGLEETEREREREREREGWTFGGMPPTSSNEFHRTIPK